MADLPQSQKTAIMDGTAGPSFHRKERRPPLWGGCQDWAHACGQVPSVCPGCADGTIGLGRFRLAQPLMMSKEDMDHAPRKGILLTSKVCRRVKLEKDGLPGNIHQAFKDETQAWHSGSLL